MERGRDDRYEKAKYNKEDSHKLSKKTYDTKTIGKD